MKKDKSGTLGMPISKASHRLNRDLIYWMGLKLGLMVCYRCGKDIDRESFTIDHKVDWLHSDAPVEVFFDLENIAFSHHTCNAAAGTGGSRRAALTRQPIEHHREKGREYKKKYMQDPVYRRKTRTGNLKHKQKQRLDPAFRERERQQQREYYWRKKGLLVSADSTDACQASSAGSNPT